MRSVTTDPIELPALHPETISRADLVFYDVDHSGASYEARIFINSPDADADTPRDDPNYAGSFHIFGHGGCFGDRGHCDVPDAPLHEFDRRPVHQLLPQRKTVTITEPLKTLLAGKRAGSVTVTVVPIVHSTVGDLETEDVLEFDRLALVTYD
jgi:tyrosinase